MRRIIPSIAATLFISLIAGSGPSSAQVVVNSPSAEVGTGTPLSGPNYSITSNLGELRGGNLFHSFESFSLKQGDTATWSPSSGLDAATVNNVVNRVTGGQVSSIDGTIDSTAYSGAAFFFINPAGMTFGPNAQINVPGALHLSAADELNLAGGGKYSARTPISTTLSAAAPEQFGFLGGGTGNITFNGTQLDGALADMHVSAVNITFDHIYGDRTGAGGSLYATAVGSGVNTVSLVDGNASQRATGILKYGNNSQIGFVNTSTVQQNQVAFRAGTINSTPSPTGNVSAIGLLNDDGDASPDSRNGDIIMEAETISLSAMLLRNFTSYYGGGRGGSGNIIISGENVSIYNSEIGTSTSGDGTAHDVTILANNTLALTSTELYSYSDGTGDSGNITISANTATLAGTMLYSDTHWFGDSGNITISGANVSILDNSKINTSTEWFGAAHDVTISADTVTLANTTLYSKTDGFGDSGNIAVSGANVSIDNSEIRTSTEGLGAAHDVTISANTLTLAGAELYSVTDGGGDSGNVTISGANASIDNSEMHTTARDDGAAHDVIISADTLTLAGTTLYSKTSGGGDSGNVTISGVNVSILDISGIHTSTSADGAAHDITISANTLTLAGATLYSETLGAGDSGNITIAGANVSVDNSEMYTSAWDDGAAHDITISANTLALTGTTLYSESRFGAGDGGNITISGANVSVGNSEMYTSTRSDNAAHDITISANTLALAGTTLYSKTFYGAGDSGNIVLTGADISIDGSLLQTITWGNGDAHDIRISAGDRITVTGGAVLTAALPYYGSGSVGWITLRAPTITLSGAGLVSSSTYGWSTTSPTPSIVFDASDSLNLREGFVVVSETRGLQTGADIAVNAGNVALSRGAGLWSYSYESADSGSITVAAAGTLVIDGIDARGASGIHSHALGSGDAGTITVNAENVVLSNGGSIAGDTGGTGDAGSIFVNASQDVSISGQDIIRSVPSGIFAESFGDGDAGNITVEARNVWLFQGGAIATRSIGTGDAGNIDVAASRYVLLRDGSSITSYVVLGSGQGGAITITNPQFFIMADSTVDSSSQLGAGGDVYVGTDYFFWSQSLFDLDGGTTNGQLIITGPLVDMSGELAELKVKITDIHDLLPELCDARLGEVTGTLTQTGRGSVPFEASQVQFASAFDMLMWQETAERAASYRKAAAVLPPLSPQKAGSDGQVLIGCRDRDREEWPVE